MPVPHAGRVSDPGVDRLFRNAPPLEIVGAAALHVDEQLAPDLDAGLPDGPLGVRAEVTAAAGPPHEETAAEGTVWRLQLESVTGHELRNTKETAAQMHSASTGSSAQGLLHREHRGLALSHLRQRNVGI